MKRRSAVVTLLAGILVLGLSPGRLSSGEFEWSGLPALENGDANGDWSIDLSDGVYLLGHLFLGGPEPAPVLCGTEIAPTQNGDVNGNGSLELSDAVYLLNWLYAGGSRPVHACGAGSGAGAATTRVPFEIEAFFFAAGPPAERVWIDDDGVQHVRRDPAPSTFTGTFDGTLDVVNNQNVDLATGAGDLFGSAVFGATFMGNTGTWEGRYSGTITFGFSTGEFIAQGQGGLEGTKIMGTFQQLDPGASLFALSGVVLTPSG